MFERCACGMYFIVRGLIYKAGEKGNITFSATFHGKAVIMEENDEANNIRNHNGLTEKSSTNQSCNKVVHPFCCLHHQSLFVRTLKWFLELLPWALFF